MAAIGALTSFATGLNANTGAAMPSANAGAQTAAPQAAVPVATPVASLEAVLGALLAAANGKGEGLASLIAELKSAMSAQTMPGNVRDAAKALLAMTADAPDGRVEAATIKAAVSQSAPSPQQGGDLKSSLLTLRNALASWPADMDAHPAQSLIDKTDAALARHGLLQAASLPDAQGDKPLRLVFDIPLQTPQGMALVQMAVERDGKDKTGDPQKKIWRASFTIDLDPLGPVHANVAMQGGRTAVTLIAERGEAARELRERLPVLHTALGQANLEPGEIECREGTRIHPQGPGILMDRAT
jgi:flagellar hook-length control protein FliK